MIQDQLRRQYSVLLSTGRSPPPNLLDVSRWYHKQDGYVRSKMDEEEPLTWMKHLYKFSSKSKRTSWSPPAFVMEEYVNAHSGWPIMDTIPENDVVVPLSPVAPSFTDTRSPSNSSYSRTTPRHSLEAAVCRTKTSFDAQVSFEPMVESGRDSLGADSRRSSGNYKGWKAGNADSAPSSLYSIGASPNNSRRRLRDLKKRLALRGSDEALSSARNSVSENSGHSASEDGGPSRPKAGILQATRPTSLHIRSSPYPTPSQEITTLEGVVAPDAPDASASVTIAESDTVLPSAAEPTPKPAASMEGSPVQSTIPRRRFRRSLPTSNDAFVQEQTRRQRSANEQKEREEYEIKAQYVSFPGTLIRRFLCLSTRVLEDTLSQNYRIRHLLQRVYGSVREYDSLQAGQSALLGISYQKIPSEVLDAFVHDPSAVTGHTRSTQGWLAVEDIHRRIQRQRETLLSFIHSQPFGSNDIVPPKNVFDDPIAQLMNALETLSVQREDLVRRSEEVAIALKRVKAVQADVKRNYNDTLAHTSLVYPEVRRDPRSTFLETQRYIQHSCPTSRLWKKATATTTSSSGISALMRLLSS